MSDGPRSVVVAIDSLRVGAAATLDGATACAVRIGAARRSLGSTAAELAVALGAEAPSLPDERPRLRAARRPLACRARTGSAVAVASRLFTVSGTVSSGGGSGSTKFACSSPSPVAPPSCGGTAVCSNPGVRSTRAASSRGEANRARRSASTARYSATVGGHSSAVEPYAPEACCRAMSPGRGTMKSLRSCSNRRHIGHVPSLSRASS